MFSTNVPSHLLPLTHFILFIRVRTRAVSQNIPIVAINFLTHTISRRTLIFTTCCLAVALLILPACSKTPQLPPLAAEGIILAFGDSLTAGTGAGETESYPAVLAQQIGRRVINAGAPGEVSASGALRLPELLDRERPALLILCHGGNDLLGRQDQRQLADNLRSMIRAARERGVSVLLVAVPAPDLSLKPPRLYRDLAGEFALPLEGTSLTRIMGKSSLKSDHVHPNAAGYRMLAEALAELLKKSGVIPH
ncbi:MAG: arylesterase [Desulfuromonadales bacterium]|nr:arylesterase [Desulfuromonadales bacterium]